jgi:hypothetical protein
MPFIRRRQCQPTRELLPAASARQDFGDATAQTINVSTGRRDGNGGRDCDECCPPRKPSVTIRILVTFSFTAAITLVFVIGTGLGLKIGKDTALEKLKQFPIGVPYPVAGEFSEGGPCPGFGIGRCEEGQAIRSEIAWSRHYLNRGDAEIALGFAEKARIFYDWSVIVGSPAGAHSARLAASRLQFLRLSCYANMNEESLTRIARDNQFNVLGGRIGFKQQQRALKALGYYAGGMTGQPDGATREAVRRFQSALWYEETEVLTPQQTVVLICGAAEIAKDAASQNLLGAMYAAGLGVKQNTDLALLSFNEAARQGSGDAYWNLALLFGTRMTETSTLVCDADLSPERADSLLKDAYDAGHPAAIEAVDRFGSIPTAKERWAAIARGLRTPEALERVGKGCNPNG